MNRLGIGGRRVQELMRHVPIIDGDGNESALLPVIPPYKRSSSCPVPKDETALIANARRRSPKVVKSSAVKEKEGILSLVRRCFLESLLLLISMW